MYAPSPTETSRLPSVPKRSVPIVCVGESLSGPSRQSVPMSTVREDSSSAFESAKLTV
jgi:hypothetical protein